MTEIDIAILIEQIRQKVCPYAVSAGHHHHRWDDRQRLYADYKVCEQLFEDISKKLAEILNAYHNTNFSVQFWEILLGPWLLSFISACVERWLRFDNRDLHLIRSEGIQIDHLEEVKFLNLESRGLDIPFDTVSYGQLVTDDDLWNTNLQLLLYIYSKNDASLINDLFADVTVVESYFEEKSSISSRGKQLGLKLLNRISRLQRKKFLMLDSLNPVLFDFLLYLSLGKVPEVNRLSLLRKGPTSNVDIDFRKKSLPSDNSSLDQFILSAALMLIPFNFLEGFLRLGTSVADYSAEPYQMILFGHCFRNDRTRYVLALGKEKNCALVGSQHGGLYGIGKFSGYEFYEHRICNYWVTWGERQSEQRGVVLKSSRPVKWWPRGAAPPSEDNRKYRSKLMIICAAETRHTHMLLANPIGSQWAFSMLHNSIFYNKLPEDLKKSTAVRLMDLDHGLNQRYWWTVLCGNSVSFDPQEKRLTAQYLSKDVSLAVVTYNATAFLESMYFDIPTIITWPSKYYEIRPEAVEDFEELKSAGVFYESAEDAAVFAARIFGDPLKWWYSTPVRNAVLRFKTKYLGTSCQHPLVTYRTLIKELTSDV